MHRADEIGVSLGTGLNRLRYRLDDDIDNKCRPGLEMPDWWISSSWVSPLESDDDNDENDEAGDGYDDSNNNNGGNNEGGGNDDNQGGDNQGGDN